MNSSVFARVLLQAARTAHPKQVFPAALTSLLKQQLSAPGCGRIPVVFVPGEIETIGDCKYALPITDDEGNRYRVTVEVVNA